ncbi:recombinase family protein [Cellulomonas denverensis]|uniref:recombinase family protein n=1 Tax=Cellulomonas denverensis TaxID=264297 RepID=UPI0035E9FF89
MSTRDQDPQRQVDALETAGCDRIWVDHGVSGKAMSRPQWDELRTRAPTTRS